METRVRRWRTAALAAGLGMLVFVVKPVSAQATTTGSLTVTITPSASYALSITTVSASMNLGTVSLGASTFTVTPATVTVTSSYAYTGLTLQGAITATANPWSFATSGALSGAQDTLGTWAVFTDTSVPWGTLGTSLGGGNYWLGTSSSTTSNVVGGGVVPVGMTGNSCPTEGSAGARFIAASGATGYKKMGCLTSNSVDAAQSKSYLWLGFQTPSATTSTNAQNVTLTLTAGAPN